MLKALLDLFAPKSAQPSGASVSKDTLLLDRQSPKKAEHPPTNLHLQYPPIDAGLPYADVHDLLQTQHDIIARLKLHAAAKDSRFELRYLQPIRELTAHINGLPGTLDGEFAGTGGLLRACMEMAFFCFQGSDGRIFTGDEGVEARHAREPRWRYICFAAGLLYPLGVSVERITVTTQDGRVWPKHSEGLTGWLKAQGQERYFVSANVSGAQNLAMGPSAYASTIVGKVLGAENLHWLESESPELTRALFEIASGSPTKADVAKNMIAGIWAKVLAREKARMPSNYGRLSTGTHLAPHLVAAMRAAVTKKMWVVNEKTLYADATGAYLVWNEAHEVLVELASADGSAVVPRSEAVLAQVLMEAAVIEKNPLSDSGLIEIQTADGEIFKAFKLRNSQSVLEDWDVTTYAKSHRLTGKSKPSEKIKPEVSPEEADFFNRQGKIEFTEPQEEQAAQTDVDNVDAPKTQNTQGGALALDNEQEVAAPTKAENKKSKAKVEKKPSQKEQAQQTLLDEADQKDPPKTHSEVSPVVKAVTPRVAAPPVQPQRGLEQQPARPAVPTSAPKPGKNAIKEAAEVSFASKLTEQLRQDLKSNLASEQVGKLLHEFETAPTAAHFKMTANGLAITFEFFGSKIGGSNPPALLDTMSSAGLIYTDPGSPGKKVNKLNMGGDKDVNAIVLSRYGMRQLGIGGSP